MSPEEHLINLQLTGEFSQLYRNESIERLMKTELTAPLFHDRREVFKALEEALGAAKTNWRYQGTIAVSDAGYGESVRMNHMSHVSREIVLSMQQGNTILGSDLPMHDSDEHDVITELHDYLRVRGEAHSEDVIRAFPGFVKKTIKLFGSKYKLRRTNAYEVFSLQLAPANRRSNEMICTITLIPKSKVINQSVNRFSIQ